MKMFTTLAVATALFGLAACSSKDETVAAPEANTTEVVPADNSSAMSDPDLSDAVQQAEGPAVQPK